MVGLLMLSLSDKTVSCQFHFFFPVFQKTSKGSEQVKSEEKSSDLQWLEDDIMQATMSQLDNEALEIIGLALLCLTKIFFQIIFKRIVINSSFKKDHRSPVPTIWVPFSGLSSSFCSILNLVLRLRISKKLISSRAPRLHISRLNSKSKEISSLELRVSVVCTRYTFFHLPIF